ncbi:MAG: SGNH/GDSL hydrolase family protein, partial [Pseudomonadota bacterium]
DSVDLALGAPSPADDDGNLALSAPDLALDGAEAATAEFVVSGLDLDATAVVTVTDSLGGTASGGIASDGTLVIDLTGLADGALTSEVTATDGDGATATVDGPELSLNGVTPTVSFAGVTDALSIDIGAGTYGVAAEVLLVGDSLTHGWLGDTDPEIVASRDVQEGYRGDLFENLLAQNTWIDYVGDLQNGPATMLDSDHEGVPGRRFGQIVNNLFGTELLDHTPDVTILMAGTNDFNASETTFFATDFNAIIANLTTAVAQFDLFGPAGSHLVVATIPPKLRLGSEFTSEIVNEGYSVVNGVEVVGDAGNGTYLPGIKQTVLDLQATNPNLYLYDAPFDTAFVGADDIHLTDAGYVAFAAGLETLLETEIGISGGTLGGTSEALDPGDDVEGGEAGDLIVGSGADNFIFGGNGNDALKGLAGDDNLSGDAGADRLEGGADVDTLIGGADGDTFVFGTDFATGHGVGERDIVSDFGDGSDILVFDDSFVGQIVVSDDLGGLGVVLSFSGVDSLLVSGADAQLLKGADLGGGDFDLVDDDELVLFVQDTDSILS